MTAIADVMILSTKIAKTVIAENQLAVEEILYQTATAEQRKVYYDKTLTTLNQRLTKTKASVYESKTLTPNTIPIANTQYVSEECEPWSSGKMPGALYSFYGNRLVNSNPNRIVGAMAVLSPPENAIGKDWKISVSDYSN